MPFFFARDCTLNFVFQIQWNVKLDFSNVLVNNIIALVKDICVMDMKTVLMDQMRPPYNVDRKTGVMES